MLHVFERPDVTARLEVSDSGCEGHESQKSLTWQGGPLGVISLVPCAMAGTKCNVRSGCSGPCTIAPALLHCTTIPVVKTFFLMFSRVAPLLQFRLFLASFCEGEWGYEGLLEWETAARASPALPRLNKPPSLPPSQHGRDPFGVLAALCCSPPAFQSLVLLGLKI